MLFGKRESNLVVLMLAQGGYPGQQAPYISNAPPMGTPINPAPVSQQVAQQKKKEDDDGYVLFAESCVCFLFFGGRGVHRCMSLVRRENERGYKKR